MSDKLIFETVGDVNYTYPYICVYEEGQKEPFMEIAATDDKDLKFTIYNNKANVELELRKWDLIKEVALKFLSEVEAGKYDNQK